jgi:hypothetical protein
MITCWSVKGGSGTSVVAALLAVAAAQKQTTLLVDVDGDQPAIFGVPNPSAGFREWWQSGLGADALCRLSTEISPTLRLVGPGDQHVPFTDRQFHLDRGSLTIVDAGTVRDDVVAAHVVEASAVSVLVIRPCYLAARRASASPLRVDGIVVVEESGRALGARDLEEVIGAPILGTLSWDLSIARAVDAGRIGNRVPRAAKSIEQMAAQLVAEAQNGVR